MTLGICTLIALAITFVLGLVTGGFKETDPANRFNDSYGEHTLEKLTVCSAIIAFILTMLWAPIAIEYLINI